MSQNKVSSRQRIVDAAIAIAINQGPKTLTLDKVAAKCGMSKGGVMHHFKNKEMLLEALLDNLMETAKGYEDSICKEHSALLPITRMLRTREQVHDHVNLDYARILLVAATENPALLNNFKQHLADFEQELQQDPERYFDSLLLWLAIDGLSFQELLSVSPFSENQRQNIRNKLISMAESLGENTGEN
ncbi:TetR/AcrR family transcriptional regulator [Salinimonas marina]|uniref:TetR/AcrR family transcriptional regulator n=1 Tax=Salinimonas marina TaxID=2785918 RepID=A0A7S9DZI5_9ALTE|nr:TetR/AcrR family transcriptional regulator [Salinimonas marina]QPG06803.1 TetR/AcrR family transcriptional regulator [Salinimonas marina]